MNIGISDKYINEHAFIIVERKYNRIFNSLVNKRYNCKELVDSNYTIYFPYFNECGEICFETINVDSIDDKYINKLENISSRKGFEFKKIFSFDIDIKYLRILKLLENNGYNILFFDNDSRVVSVSNNYKNVSDIHNSFDSMLETLESLLGDIFDLFSCNELSIEDIISMGKRDLYGSN